MNMNTTKRYLIVVPALIALALGACGGSSGSPHLDEQGHEHEDRRSHGENAPHSEAEKHEEGDRHETDKQSDVDTHDEETAHGETLRLTPEARDAAGLTIAPAGPSTLVETLLLYGAVVPNAERTRAVSARFPGMVRSVDVSIGDRVRQGAMLATVESNESLRTFAVTSPLDGTVINRFTNPGEQADREAMFVVADLSSVWVDLALYPRDRGRVQVGQSAQISAEGPLSALGKVIFVSPMSARETQSQTARVLLENVDGIWTPGLNVQGHVAIGEFAVSVAVPDAALQQIEDSTSVFVEHNGELEVRPVRVGRNDGRNAEILEGLKAGESVVVEGSFVLKAELGKGEAEHGH